MTIRTLFVVFIFLLSMSVNSSIFAATDPYLITVQQLKAGLDKAMQPAQKGFILIDVRSSEEHESGYIPGTDFNIDFRDIQNRHRDIHAKSDDHIVVYCQSGHRSNIAAETLMKLGYQHVYNVAGSMNAWEDAGYTIQRPQ